jgi:zinc/manganese transport system substrate-binding protein
MTRSRLLPVLLAPVLVPALAVGLAGCGGGAGAVDDARVAVVASTDVYGDVASAIGGDLVEVTSLIDSPAQDPHSFEASARDRLAVAEARLVIENGGGYDPFMVALVEASPSDDRIVLDAVELSGLAPEDAEGHAEEEHADEDDHGHAHIEGFNEHVWYDLHTVEHLAEAIAESLGELDPGNADVFDANAADFLAGLEQVHEQASALAERADGLEYALTEPVPAYLLAELGLVNLTPEAFSEAIEEGSDVAPRDLADMLEIIDAGAIRFIAYNDQTQNAQTEQVRSAAEAAGIPVLSFAETLPDGQDYLAWMSSNLDAVAAALD